MDKNTITGLVIIGLMVLGFTLYNSNQTKKFNEEKAVRDSIALVQEREQSAQTETLNLAEMQVQDSLQTARAALEKQSALGDVLYRSAIGEEKIYTVENDVARFSISNKGARIVGVELKDYDNKFSGGPVQMIAPESAVFDMSFFISRNYNNFQVRTGEYYFDSNSGRNIVVNDGGTKLAFRLMTDSLSYVEYTYTFKKDEYMLDFDVNFVNMDRMLANQSDILFNWESIAPQQEKGFENENKYTTISYKYPGDDSIEDLGISEGSKSEDEANKVQWIAFKQQFFSSIFIAKDNFLNAEMKYDSYAPGHKNIKRYYASIAAPFNKQQTAAYGFQFYYGPNKFSILKEYKDLGIQRLVPLGGWVIRWVNTWVVITVFDILSNSIASYGLIILILTVLIKLLVLPLTYRSHLSMAKMRVLKPELDELNEKFPNKDDAMKKQMAVQELYKKAGVNPLGGCLPLLIQFPILIAMFRFFPASIELRGESFLWAEDLSSYDSILQLPFEIPFYGNHVSLFTLLMAASVFISSKINYSLQSASSSQQMPGMKFMMLYLMPIMLMVWFNNYASGLSYYYLLSNIITIGQTFLFRRIVNEDKLHARMKERAANPKAKKKSKWAQRYEEALKMQMEQQGVKQPLAPKQRKKPQQAPKKRK